MFADQLNIATPSKLIDTLEKLFEYIDADTFYPLRDDEISFDPKEWQIKDVSKKKIRPPRLCEFLRLLLNNERYITYASWLDKDEGLFKIHKPAVVAELWRTVRGRHSRNTMDYDKFSRSIRYYYESGIMIATYTKHTYRFAIHK